MYYVVYKSEQWEAVLTNNVKVAWSQTNKQGKRRSNRTKDFIYQDGKVRLFDALPACSPKMWSPYWKRDSER